MNYTSFTQTLLGNCRGGTTYLLTLWGQYYPYSQARQRHYEKRLHRNIPYEHTCKNSTHSIANRM